MLVRKRGRAYARAMRLDADESAFRGLPVSEKVIPTTADVPEGKVLIAVDFFSCTS